MLGWLPAEASLDEAMSSPIRNRNTLDSPSRQLLSEARRNGSSPSRNSMDSPSNQLLFELSRMLIDSDREFHARLDEHTAEREKAHREALATAAAEHDRVRIAAERACERFQLQLEREKSRREEEERRELDRVRQEKAEQEIAERKRQIEQVKRVEEQRRRAAEEAKALAEAEARLQAQKREEDADAARKAKEEAEKLESDRKARKAAAAAEKARLNEAKQAPANALSTSAPANATSAAIPVSLPKVVQSPSQNTLKSAPPGIVSSISQREAEQHQYLQLHKRLKDLRKFMLAQSKQIPALGQRLGDMRRNIKKSVGQLTGEKEANKIPLYRIRELLNEALQLPSPGVDVRPFIISSTVPSIQDSEAQAPGLLLYLLNIFSKAVIAQFIDEAGVSPKAAEPVGLVAVSVFADKAYKWHGVTLIDMLIAKYRVVCPVLWGIYGDDKTEAGRTRLGWGRMEPGGPWVSEQRHGERMTGLGAGFAAITLRDFSKSKMDNPLPNTHYWRAMARIVNTPPHEATQTHFLVLKAMVEHSISKFVGFYGQAALVALRKALVEFPAQAPKSAAASAVAVLPEVLKRDLSLSL